MDAWTGEMTAIARDPRMFCKLSGLVTEAGPGASPHDLWPYIDVLLDAFGPGRVMWGSDWPVVNLASNYDDWLESASRAVARSRGAADQDWIFGRTAADFYGLQT